MNENAGSDELTALITEMYGSDTAAYVTRKNTGGRAGQKGSHYETLFLAFRSAELLSALTIQPIDSLEFDVRVAGQVLGFVDDGRINTKNQTIYYQAKNVAAVSWKSMPHPIESDFSHQYALSIRLNEPDPRTYLVVPTERLAAALAATMPDHISEHSLVVFFPYCGGSCNRLVLEFEPLRNILSKITRAEHPTVDQMEAAFGVLLHTLSKYPTGCTMRELVSETSRIFPAQLRMFGAETGYVLLPEFQEMLCKIPGLGYDLQRGYFSWSAMGTTGTLPFPCADGKFIDFQRAVVQAKPDSFDRFEELLP